MTDSDHEEEDVQTEENRTAETDEQKAPRVPTELFLLAVLGNGDKFSSPSNGHCNCGVYGHC